MFSQSSFIDCRHALIDFADKSLFLLDKLFDGVCDEPGTGPVLAFRLAKCQR
jgi:hypothetical protein